MKKFMNPEIEVQAFAVEDIVTTSAVAGGGTSTCPNQMTPDFDE